MSLNQDVILDHAQKYTEIVSDDQYQEEQKQLNNLPVVFQNRMWTWDDLAWIVRWKTRVQSAILNAMTETQSTK